MLTLYENIRIRREALGLTKSALAEIVGYDRSMITKIEQGKVDLTQSKILAFADALKTTPSQLMGFDEQPAAPNIISLPETKKVPLLGTIACGEPILANENVSDYIDMDATVHADFALRCKGDSMINARIFDGDIVYIRKQSDVENGEIAGIGTHRELIKSCDIYREIALSQMGEEELK